MADFVLSIASKVAEYLVAPVIRQCSYMIFSDSHVRQLNGELTNLDLARQRVQHSVRQAQNNMKPIEADVNQWETEAETIANKADEVLKDERAKKTCFYGWLPNPKTRYHLGKEAVKMVKDIQELTARQFKKVHFENPPPGIVGDAPNVKSLAGDGGDTITDSRASIFQGIMKALADEKHKVIGVYGPGGVGKSTLLEEVEEKLRKEGRPFDMIVKSKVSQTPDLTKIQYNIAYALSLNDLKDEPSEEGKRDLLFKRLQKNPSEKILIILDDLWAELDLKAVGIPLGDESTNCKLLLTSRDKSVLEQQMHADQTFHLEGLKADEAFRLFEKIVGDRLKDNEELNVKAAQVVTKLAGLPLLIRSVASILKVSDVSSWENMLIKVEDSNNERIVKWSYDYLKSEDAKCLFLLCGLIGGTIEVELLLGLGMGLGLFEGYNKTIERSRNRLNAMLDSLHSICLLQDGGDDKETVTIHDLYSEVVASTPLRGQNSLIMNNNCGPWPKEKLEKCWAICLTDVGDDNLAQLMPCQFSDLKILMFSYREYCRRPLAHPHDVGDGSGLIDFTYMKELRVLYLRFMHITTLPSSIQILGNLRSLYLDNCLIEEVAILGKLKALQVLSFTGSKISRLPKEIGELTNLRSLNLSNCNNLKIIEPGVLKALINLEELYMKKSFYQWMGKDKTPSELSNARLAELKSLTKLTALEIWIPDPTILLEDGDLPFGNLIRFWIKIGKVSWITELMEFKGLRIMKLKLEGCHGILLKEWVKKTLHKTEYLHLDGLREFKNANELCIQGFPQLKHLDIQNSPSIKYIASSSNDLILTAFTILESLTLHDFINLEKICHGPVDPKCFSKLKFVNVRKCDRLKNLWCLSKMERPIQLEEILVWECDSMQAIIAVDAEEDLVATDDIIELPNVRRMELGNLPNMTSFNSGAGITSEGAFIQVILPSLEYLGLYSLGSFRRLWHSELGTSSFCKLATLTVENCSELLNLFPLTIIGSLHHLKRVEVSNCPSLGSLFDCGFLDSYREQTKILLPNLASVKVERCPSLKSLFDYGTLDLNTEQKIVLLPKLEILWVKGAGRLRHIVKSDSQMVLGFPSLKSAWVESCSHLRYLFPYLTATTLEKLEILSIDNCEQIEEVVLKETAKGKDESPQPLFNEMVVFPNIRCLLIVGAQCKEIWSNQIPDDSFCKLECLFLGHCDNLLRIAPSHMWKRLHCCLEILSVISCRSIEIIYENDGTVTKSGKLRRLVLNDLQNLRHGWLFDGRPNILFPNLRYIEVSRCSRLEMLFPTFTPKFLGQIQELVVESCEDIELIVGHEECEEATDTTITFSKLIVLRLFELPKFRSFLHEKYILEFPSLKVLSRVSCGTVPDQVLGDWESYQQSRKIELARELSPYLP